MERQMIVNHTTLALIAALGPGAALIGCTPFPQVGNAASDAALAQPYPDLVPLEQLDTRLGTGRVTPDDAPAIEARVADLKDRAARLSGSVIDPATRARMQTGVRQ
jgi:hypothetical protein